MGVNRTRRLKKWSKDIRNRDGACDCCGSKKELTAHHLESYHANWHLRFDMDNGVALCRICHETFHFIFGYTHNTRTQYYEFKEKHAEARLLDSVSYKRKIKYKNNGINKRKRNQRKR